MFLEENRNFPKTRWVRSRKVFLSSARLYSLVVNKRAVLRTCWDLSTWNNTCFSFKCKITFWLRYFSKATFGTFALSSCVWDVVRCRILEKTAFDFFRKRGLRRFVLCAKVLMIFAQTFRKLLGDFAESKTQNFQKNVE